jgi:PASTA domain
VVEEQPSEQQPGDRPDEPAGDQTAVQRSVADDTAVLPPAGDRTAVQRSAADDTALLPPAEPRWSARAGVPVEPRRPAPVEAEEQWGPEPGPTRAWWLPILIGLAVLVLVGLIGLGLWLALRGSAPAPQASTPPSPVVSSPSPAPTASPSGSPSVAMVAVPRVTDLAVSDALPILQSQGLVPRVVTDVNDSVPAGTVISTDPAAGTQVPVGSTVTVHVATPTPSSAPPTSAAPQPSG